MQMRSVASAVVAVALLMAGLSGQQQAPRGPYAPDEILVKFNPGASALQRDTALTGRGARSLRRFRTLGIDLVRLPAGQTIEAAIAAFRATPGVLYAQPNYFRRTTQTAPPNDPHWLDSSLWGLDKIQMQQTWTAFTAGDGSVIVADIDTGIDYTHPDLAANMWRNPGEVPDNGIDDDGNGYVDDVHGIDTANHDSDPMDDQGHGTHTSGTVAAVGNNGIGVVGVNWNARILSCKFLDSTGYGTDAGAIECFDYIVALRTRGVNIRVSTNSWGSPRAMGPPAAAIEAAIDAAGAVGIINIFGAGNDGANNDVTPFDPASYTLPSIVAVASSGPTDRRSSFSNYGAVSVDIAAPGQDILSTYPGGGYEYNSGTSMATPHVAGVAALLASMDPTLSVAAIKSLILDNVDQFPRWDGVVSSGGRLNAFRAASAVSAGTPNTPPTASMTGPSDGATYKMPVNIVVTADASDSDGTVASVTFFANGAPIGVDTTSPYSVTWVNAPAGSFGLTAMAADNLGATSTSAAVNVTVIPNFPPSVSITSPAEGATFASPATLTVEATADDSDGVVQHVQFFANGTAIGTDTTSPYSVTWEAPLGSYLLTAVATDNAGATATSPAVTVTVDPIPGRVNVALAANGGAATASSTLNANYPASAVTNGDRKGLNWGAGGGWNDGTPNTSPDWVEINFTGQKLIEEVNVFSMQDSYTAPVEPTPTLEFTLWGLRAFEVQYWTGTDWAVLPGGAVTNNNLVWRRVVFVPVTTSKIRVHITAALNGSSRVMEVEAWGVSAGGNTPPTVAIASPAEGATFTAPASVTVTADAADSDGAVASVEFFVNDASIGTSTTSPYSVPWIDVAAGSYTLTAVVTDNQGATATSSAVHVTVLAPNAPPTVSITTPTGGAVFVAPANLAIDAAAEDGDGSVQQVTFYVNGASIGTDATSPYSVPWTNVSSGNYTLTAVATDNLGATTTSAAVMVTVNQPPGRMNMARASNGGVASASSTLNANYPAAGTINGDRRGLGWGAGGGWNDGTSNTYPDWLQVNFSGSKAIDEVNVFSMQDNYSAPIEPTPTQTFGYWGLRAFEVQYWNGTAWAAVPGGAVTNNNLVWRRLVFAPVTTTRIRVHITAALNGFSRMVELEAWGVAAGGNTAPTVSIASPSEGATFTAPANITVTADAADIDGTVASVAFFANGAPIGTDTTSPFSAAWTNVAAGSHTLTAVATDNLGATTTSTAVHVTVAVPNVPPSASITSPAEGAVFTAPAAITVTAATADSDGTIASVAFFANGAPIGTDTTSPYTVAWTNVAAGSHTLSAVATDNQGAATTSAAVHVTVTPPIGRLNMALAANGGVATASSTYSANYPAAGTINGDRKGLFWGAGGGWNDGTPNTSPDWLEITFNGSKTIDEVNVFTMQDNYTAPVEPTPTLTFGYWGIRAFEVQYWTGTAWAAVPGGSVTNNNLVWRRFVFAPVTTTRIRVYITGALNGFSRVMEVEAWGVAGTAPESLLTYLTKKPAVWAGSPSFVAGRKPSTSHMK